MKIERASGQPGILRGEPGGRPGEAPPAQADRFEAGPAAGLGERKTVTFTYDARQAPTVARVALQGSFNADTGVHDPAWNGGQPIPMRDDGRGGDEVAGDRIFTAQVGLREGQPQRFEWGAIGDVQGPGDALEESRWLIMTESPPSFHLGEGERFSYAPVATHLWGVHREGEDSVRFRAWSPAVGQGDLAGHRLHVEVFGRDGALLHSVPMEKEARGGGWQVTLEDAWSDLEGCSYEYAVRAEDGAPLLDGQGQPVRYADPFARYLQGPQRGVERLFVDPVLGFETGWYDDSAKGGPNYADNPQWARFSVDGWPEADSVRLVLKDPSGRPLGRQELLDRLGEPRLVPYDQAAPSDRRDVDVLRAWQLDGSAPITAYAWTEGLQEDGSIELKRLDSPWSGTAWVTAMNGFPKLEGLRYELQARAGGELVGDVNGDGLLQEAERRRLPFNDPHTDVIQPRPGSARRSLIRESSYEFRHDRVPRKETDFRRFVIYEAHVGSFMGSKDNALASTFEDMVANLDYLESLGVNSLELMPTAEFAGKRDWGYTPDHYFAGADAYGFSMDREQAARLKLIRPDQDPGQERVWISGTDALKFFVDEAHGRGFNVFADVVYNHASGKADGDNPLYRIDGDRRSFFRWFGEYESHTPWGAKPNYAEQGVKDFFSDHAAQQVLEFGFDGVRFDFTQVLHATGPAAEQVEGMNTLRQIHRTLQLVRPGLYTVAEDFSGSWLVGADLDRGEWQGEGGYLKRGMGFQGVWNDRFHDDLLGLAQGTVSADRFMDALLHHHGVTGWDRGVVYAHSHDEVGNTGNWIGRAAAGSREDGAVARPYPRAVARTAAALTLTAPGVPMIFQGEEFAANHDFKHGLTSTWGSDLGWREFQVTPDRLDRFREILDLPRELREVEVDRLDPRERELLARVEGMGEVERARAVELASQAGHFALFQELAALRRSSEALTATAPVERVYTHNDDRVVAFRRVGQGEEVVVVSNFSDGYRSGLRLPLAGGGWRVALNTDARRYGGGGAGTPAGEVDPAAGLALPGGGTLILRRDLGAPGRLV